VEDAVEGFQAVVDGDGAGQLVHNVYEEASEFLAFHVAFLLFGVNFSNGSAVIIGRPTGDDHTDDDADCGGNQRYVQKVQSVSVLGNVEVQENDADVEAYGDSSFLGVMDI